MLHKTFSQKAVKFIQPPRPPAYYTVLGPRLPALGPYVLITFTAFLEI